MKNKFKVAAPYGLKTAYRWIVAPNGTPVLGVSTGEYLQRIGNLRESVVYVLKRSDNPKRKWENDVSRCLYCDYGGIIRKIIHYLHRTRTFEKWELDDMGDEMLDHLNELRKRYLTSE